VVFLSVPELGVITRAAHPAGRPPGKPPAPQAFMAFRKADAAAPVGRACGRLLPWPPPPPPPKPPPWPNPGGGVTPCFFRHWLKEVLRAGPDEPADAGDGEVLLAAHPAVTVAASATDPRPASQPRRRDECSNRLVNGSSLGLRWTPSGQGGPPSGTGCPHLQSRACGL
jgi:hypothetical protein